jgi:hypothetical protein
MTDWTSTVPIGLLLRPGCSTFVLCPKQHCPLALPSLFWTPLTFYHLELEHAGLRRIWSVPRGFVFYGARSLSGLSSLWDTPRIPASLGLRPRLLLDGLCLMDSLGHQVFTPLCFHYLVCNISARMNKGHCWNTLLRNNGHINETVTYVRWHEERLWNISVLQREHFSSPFWFCLCGL